MAVKFSELNYGTFGNCVCLENGRIKLIATADAGPRIVWFGAVDGNNMLFEDNDRNFYEINRGYGVWYAYGGHRVWTAPEVMPETYLPDNSGVVYNFCNNTLTLIAPVTIFGKQISMEITMNDDNTVDIVNKIENCSAKPAYFAPWSITGLAAGGTEYIPLCKDDNGFLPNRTMALWSYSDIKDERFDLTNEYAVLRQDPQNKKAFKAGFNVTDGYVEYCKDSCIFRMTFDNYRKAEYPDFCCNYETYTNHLFLECELLGELKSYAPGESAVIREKWAIIKNKDLDESERKDG
jgi:hypothetical protein